MSIHTIHKFRLDFSRPTVVEAPADAKPLHAALQGNDVCVWVELDPTAPKVKHAFEIVGTGWHVPSGWSYVGTVFIGQFVWHVYTAAEGVKP